MTFSSFSTSLSGKETRYSLLFFILVVVGVKNKEEINMSLFTVNTINEVKPKVFCLDGPFFNKLDVKDL